MEKKCSRMHHCSCWPYGWLHSVFSLEKLICFLFCDRFHFPVAYSSYGNGIISIDRTRQQLRIALTIQQFSDTEILLRCSTSPYAEGPDFVDNERRYAHLIRFLFLSVLMIVIYTFIYVCRPTLNRTIFSLEKRWTVHVEG